MKETIRKLKADKKSLAEICKITGLPLSFVNWTLYGMPRAERLKKGVPGKNIFNVHAYENWIA